MIKVIVAGGRDFYDYELLQRKLIHHFHGLKPEDVEIVSGGARGADKLGERFAEEHGCKLTIFNADWDRWGKSAGYRRNTDMANYADACVCFWDEKSKGTKHMIDIAIEKGIPVKIVRY
jgi:YspA, cpYpsA-related SLOG family